MTKRTLLGLGIAVGVVSWIGCAAATDEGSQAEQERQRESSPAIKRKQREAAHKAIEGTTEAMQSFRLPDGHEVDRRQSLEHWLTAEEVNTRTGWTQAQIDDLVREGRLRPAGRPQPGRLSVPVYDPDQVDQLQRQLAGQEDRR